MKQNLGPNLVVGPRSADTHSGSGPMIPSQTKRDCKTSLRPAGTRALPTLFTAISRVRTRNSRLSESQCPPFLVVVLPNTKRHALSLILFVMARIVTLYGKLCIFLSLFLSLTTAEAQVKEERRFFFDSEGWTCHGAACDHHSEPLTVRRGSLIGRDEGKHIWYFSAPDDYLQRLKCAFSLQFRLAHLEFDSRGESEMHNFDVLLMSHDNVTIGLNQMVCPFLGSLALFRSDSISYGRLTLGKHTMTSRLSFGRAEINRKAGVEHGKISKRMQLSAFQLWSALCQMQRNC